MKFALNKIFISIIFFAFLANSALLSAKGPVWKVSKGGQTVYLGGTIHLLSPSDYPLPEEFEEAQLIGVRAELIAVRAAHQVKLSSY